MFIVGLIVLVLSIIFIYAGIAAKKRGDFRTASVGLVGRIGVVLGIILVTGSGIRIIGPGEVGVQDLFGRDGHHRVAAELKALARHAFSPVSLLVPAVVLVLGGILYVLSLSLVHGPRAHQT